MDKYEIHKIKFHFLIKPFHFNNRSRLKKFLLNSFKSKRKKVEAINYIFCSDDYLLGLNISFLKHDTYTDIITFELSPKKQPLLSDIYISIDRVRENAQNFQTSFRRELHRVIFHGALHLCGDKDKRKSDAAVMRRNEEDFLRSYFISSKTTKGKN